MDLSKLKLYFTRTLEAFDPRSLMEEFSASKAIWSCSQPDAILDIYATYKTHEKVALIMKPYFKLLGYLALAATIVLASLHLSPFTLVAGIMIALSAILTVGATYVANPNYFQEGKLQKFSKYLSSIV